MTQFQPWYTTFFNLPYKLWGWHRASSTSLLATDDNRSCPANCRRNDLRLGVEWKGFTDKNTEGSLKFTRTCKHVYIKSSSLECCLEFSEDRYRTATSPCQINPFESKLNPHWREGRAKLACMDPSRSLCMHSHRPFLGPLCSFIHMSIKLKPLHGRKTSECWT